MPFMIITEREIPNYYRAIKEYLDRAITEIAPDIKLREKGWGFEVDKSSYPAIRCEIEVNSDEDRASLVNRRRVDGPPRQMHRLPDKTYDLREGIVGVCESVLEQLREAQALTNSARVQI